MRKFLWLDCQFLRQYYGAVADMLIDKGQCLEISCHPISNVKCTSLVSASDKTLVAFLVFADSAICQQLPLIQYTLTNSHTLTHTTAYHEPRPRLQRCCGGSKDRLC